MASTESVDDVRSKFSESYARQNQMVSLMDKLLAKKGNAALLEKQKSIKRFEKILKYLLLIYYGIMKKNLLCTNFVNSVS